MRFTKALSGTQTAASGDAQVVGTAVAAGAGAGAAAGDAPAGSAASADGDEEPPAGTLEGLGGEPHASAGRTRSP